MAQVRSTEIISMIKWIRTSRLSINKYFSQGADQEGEDDLASDGEQLLEAHVYTYIYT